MVALSEQYLDELTIAERTRQRLRAKLDCQLRSLRRCRTTAAKQTMRAAIRETHEQMAYWRKEYALYR